MRGGLFAAFARARRIEGLVELALLFVLLTVATAGVTGVLIAPDWQGLWRCLLFGLLAGWLSGVLRQPAWRAALILLFLGGSYALLAPGGLSPRAAAILPEVARLAEHITITSHKLAIDFSALAQVIGEFIVAMGVVLERLRVWVTALATGEPVFDPVASALAWNILVWIVAAWSGWVVEARKNALLAVLPAILLSVSSLAYSLHANFTLYTILGLSLILIAMTQHDRRKQEWDQAGVVYPARKGREMANTVLVVTGALVVLSAVVASLSLSRIVDWLTPKHWASASQDSGLAKSLGIRPAATSAPDEFEAVRRPGLPRDLLIGSGPELSRRIVMTVDVQNLPSLSVGGNPPSFYWRSFTYDVYTGHGWRSSATQQSAYEANQPLQPQDLFNHRLVQQAVRRVDSSDVSLYAAGEPISIDLPSQAAWRSSGDLFGVQLNNAGAYDALSLIPVVSENTLRAAGQRYPDWLRGRFLALPPDIPVRVKDLAIELTAAEPTPYDRARAIERYLRTFPYSLDVPRPPAERDLVDYFLFDLKQGYCDYYASAMVVLARLAGIPARLVIGYANGTYDLNSRRFQVTEADAHSWVEVYFPETGWVPFEPTAARPELAESPGRIDETSQPANPAVEPPAADVGRRFAWGWYLLAGGLAGAALLGAGWLIFDGMRLRGLTGPASAVEVYRRMRRYGKILAASIETGDTPYEFALSLGKRIQELAPEGFNPAFGEGTVQDIQAITRAIVRSSYRPWGPASALDSPVLRQWMGLRWKLSLMWALKYWKSLRERVMRTWFGMPGNMSDNKSQEG